MEQPLHRTFFFNDTEGSSTNGGCPSTVIYSGTGEVTGASSPSTGGQYAEIKISGDVFGIGSGGDFSLGLWKGVYITDGTNTTHGIISNWHYDILTNETNIYVHCNYLYSVGANVTVVIGGKVTTSELEEYLQIADFTPINLSGIPENVLLAEFKLESDYSHSGQLALPDLSNSSSADDIAIWKLNLGGNTLTITGSSSSDALVIANSGKVSQEQYHSIVNGTLICDKGLLLSAAQNTHVVTLKELDARLSAGDIASTNVGLLLIDSCKIACGDISGSEKLHIVNSQVECDGISATDDILSYRSYVNCDSHTSIIAIKTNLITGNVTNGITGYDMQISSSDTSTTDRKVKGDGIIIEEADDSAIDVSGNENKITVAEEIPDPPQILTEVDSYGGAIEQPPSFVDKLYRNTNEVDPHYFAGVPQPYYFRKIEDWDVEYVTYYVYKYGQLKLKEPIEDLVYRVARMVGIQPDLDEKGRETILDALDAAVQMICTAYDWNFMRQRTTLQVKQGTYEYNLEEEGTPYPLIDCYRIYSIRYNDENYSDFLKKRNYRELERVIGVKDIDTGRPLEYAMFTPTRLILNKIPDADYDLQVIYQRRHPSIQVLKTLLVPDFLVPAIVQLAKEIYKSESSSETVALLQMPVVQQLIQNAMAQDANMQYDDEGAVSRYGSDEEMVLRFEL